MSGLGQMHFWDVQKGVLSLHIDLMQSPVENNLHTRRKSDIDLLRNYSKDDYVVSLSSDGSKFIVTGDTKGIIKVWSIAGLRSFVNASGKRSPRRSISQSPSQGGFQQSPCLLYGFWQAHQTAVTCVDFVHTQRMILSASSDLRIKLWTLDGRYIGIFGQKRKWNLEHSITWRSNAPLARAMNKVCNFVGMKPSLY